MKKIFTILLSMIIASMTMFATADGDIVPIDLHSDHSSGTQQRSPENIPLSGYTIGNVVYIMSHYFFQDVTVTISRINNGAVLYNQNIDVSTIPYSISLAGTGEFYIQIILSSGQIYYGTFDISSGIFGVVI